CRWPRRPRRGGWPGGTAGARPCRPRRRRTGRETGRARRRGRLPWGTPEQARRSCSTGRRGGSRPIDGDPRDLDHMPMKPPISLPTSTVGRNAVVAISVVAVGWAVYWLADILTPLAMAIFLMIMIDGVKRFIESRTPVPSHLAGAAALVVVIVGFFASIGIVVYGAAGFFDE